MNMIATQVLVPESAPFDKPASEKQGVVLIVSDNAACIEKIAPVCDFLDLQVHHVTAGTDLLTMLRVHRPMAVIADVEGVEQDGFHVMKVIAAFNRDMPIMLLTDGDPVLMGAADAIQDIWGLRAVTLTGEFPPAGQIVSFLFAAGRGTGCLRLVPV
jgi:hypothetical protein